MSSVVQNPGLADAGNQVGNMIGGGLAALGNFKVFFAIIFALICIGACLYIFTIFKKKKTQWTHLIEVQRITPSGELTEKVVHKARRYQLATGTENFELEKPILGNLIIPRVGDYINNNTLAIYIDKDNRLYKKGGTTILKDGSEQISLVHAGVDVAWADLKAKYQYAHKNAKKITTAELIKAGITALIIIGIVIVAIMLIEQWSVVSEYKVQQAEQQAIAMENLGEALKSMESVVNTQQLQLTPMIQALYGKEDISSEINKYKETE